MQKQNKQLFDEYTDSFKHTDSLSESTVFVLLEIYCNSKK